MQEKRARRGSSAAKPTEREREGLQDNGEGKDDDQRERKARRGNGDEEGVGSEGIGGT